MKYDKHKIYSLLTLLKRFSAFLFLEIIFVRIWRMFCILDNFFILSLFIILPAFIWGLWIFLSLDNWNARLLKGETSLGSLIFLRSDPVAFIINFGFCLFLLVLPLRFLILYFKVPIFLNKEVFVLILS